MKRLTILLFSCLFLLTFGSGCSMLGGMFGGDDEMTITELIDSYECITQCVEETTLSNAALIELGKKSLKKK